MKAVEKLLLSILILKGEYFLLKERNRRICNPVKQKIYSILWNEFRWSTKHFGGLKDYRASEGREVLASIEENVANTIQTILGGVRSACTYAGALRLKHFIQKCATFVRTNKQYNAVYESSTTKNVI